MIYTNNSEYKVKFYKDSRTGDSPVLEYIDNLSEKERTKVFKYIEFLREHQGVLDEPYSKHIKSKIRELRVDFARQRHRIFYFTFIKKTIILLHAFLKTTAKTPQSEIKMAEENYNDVLNNEEIYE
ncbi:MAG: type II toxin-antitoxin system RelE/ParE family toxin [Patescibacteria group bacterium]|nr:type II toxin-antitoxin system RelE/ParE family toxin [Patescibacteria group bacterium]MDD5164610.1 type II toxin-antitoxin system RelE/ParE family toxin [Patescibacteria group bacterium]MDD5534548.1 type II toxin-antitoxin system RelE/ParE family toxin [Patescibacteria group bacterium]